MTSRPAIANRSSTSKPSGPQLQTTSTSLLSSSASLTGTHPVTLGPRAIVQLRARLTSEHGPVSLGEECIISERAIVGLLSPPQNGAQGVTLARGVLVESAAVVEAAFVGAYTIIEAGAKVGKGVTVGERSKICAGVEIGHGQTVGNDTVVYGSAWGDRRQEKRGLGLDEARTEWVDAQGLALRRLWTGK